MTGAYGVFMMLTPMSGVQITAEGIAAEIRWGTTVVDLAAELSLAHLIYSSLRGAGQNTGVDYHAAKEAVEARIHETGRRGGAPTPHDSVFHRVFGVPANAASQLRAVLRIARYAYGYGAESVYRQAA